MRKRAAALPVSEVTSGPGPLISYLTGKAAARLRIPITIVPGGLTLDQVDALT